MIIAESILNIIDNSGGKIARCICIYGGTKVRYANIGDMILVTVRKAIPNGKVKKGEMYKAIIVRSKYGISRKNGMHIKFFDNAIVLLDENKVPIGTRVNTCIALEIKMLGFNKISSIANSIV